MNTDKANLPPRPPFWVRLSIVQGNVLQIVGIGAGMLLLYWATQLPGNTLLQIVLMLLGWLAIYICSHALAHWVVGRLVGIRFIGYGIRGSDHPYDYPPILGLPRLMQYFPTFTAMTRKESIQVASPLAKALMFAAGETSTTVCSLGAAAFAMANGVPGSALFFVAMVIFSLLVTYVTAVTPRGDYAKALRALRGPTV